MGDPFFSKNTVRRETLVAAIRRVQERGGRAWAYVQAVGTEHWGLVDVGNEREGSGTKSPPDSIVGSSGSYSESSAWPFPPVAAYDDADPGFFKLLRRENDDWMVHRTNLSEHGLFRHFPC